MASTTMGEFWLELCNINKARYLTEKHLLRPGATPKPEPDLQLCAPTASIAARNQLITVAKKQQVFSSQKIKI
jgi:hypothetical protein